ncbi:MAG: restriction endonuclease subunit S, partial [Deltaproteobacteria bacterium]|nr:restriction endonuclease subunit S [Deltaproteobacteria bacterium]
GEHLAEPRTLDLFTGDRILLQRIVSAECLEVTFTNEPFICNTDIITLKPLNNNKNHHILYFLGLLASRPICAFVKSQNVNLDRDAFPKINTRTLSSLPIRTIDFNSPKDKTLHDKMVSHVDRMLDLNKKLQSARIAHDREFLERQLKITDDQIDRLVYELYGVTEEEIGIIES